MAHKLLHATPMYEFILDYPQGSSGYFNRTRPQRQGATIARRLAVVSQAPKAANLPSPTSSSPGLHLPSSAVRGRTALIR
jgi:hypothetical protein